MRFVPSGEVETPSYLFQHEKGSTRTYLRPEFNHLFEHSASSSFFAYVPLYFWRQILHETNKYAVMNDVRMGAPFTLDELMIFLGILFYMAVTDKGEYANYWGRQAEDLIFGGVSTSLDGVMTLHRFKLLRRCFSFNAAPTTLEQDAVARIRPLLNLLKITGGKYIRVGRNVALDEASVACRSCQGRHVIKYNPKKPTGKYHFRFYMVCCSTTWIALNYKLHCQQSDVMHRLGGVINQSEAQSLSDQLAKLENAKIRQHASMDAELSARRASTTQSTVFCTRPIAFVEIIVSQSHMTIAHDHSMLAVSWCDGNIVNMLSNADSSTVTSVTRLIGSEKQSFPAPECIAQYNTNMQGVERLDQIRGRFSIADGHSFEKWHKKLSLALIDMARSNAYLTRRLVTSEQGKSRDPHRDFVIELLGELISGQWKNAPNDGRMFYSGETLDDGDAEHVVTPSPLHQEDRAFAVATTACDSVSSRQIPRSSGGSGSDASETDGGVGPLGLAAFGLGGGGSIHGLVAFARSRDIVHHHGGGDGALGGGAAVGRGAELDGGAALGGGAVLRGGAAALAGDAALGGGAAALGGDAALGGGAAALAGDTPHDGSAVVLDGGEVFGGGDVLGGCDALGDGDHDRSEAVRD
ncbi:unnamed protein product [Phytophthora fragariaefolia]|uniref:Unnamed protein product n=1 Tax=Phytophthora fragariaefolia TaxID=1490495 RepID=A0A9W6X265_9STRA|nr:unnamed protein product [Phytophthora fragariaefolia]